MQELDLEELAAVGGGGPGVGECRAPSGWWDNWRIRALRQLSFSDQEIAELLFYR